MRTVPSRDLRNGAAALLRRAQAGEEVTITVRGQPVAQLGPIRRTRRRWLGRAELAARLRTGQADAGLRDDLARLAGETTDDLGPIR
jgi:prevent-host-death family protein